MWSVANLMYGGFDVYKTYLAFKNHFTKKRAENPPYSLPK